MRKQKNKTSILIDKYLVTLTNLHNTRDGAPRYEATITDLENAKISSSTTGYTYRFRGHYCGDRGEALYVLLYHLTFVVDDISEVKRIKEVYKEEV